MIAPLILFGGVIAILLADLWLYLRRGGYEATITAWVKASRMATAIVAFLLGTLFGHLFL